MRSLRNLLLCLVAALTPALPVVAAPASAADDARSRPATGTFFWANAWAAHHTARPGGARPGAERMRRLVRLVEGAHVGLGTLAELERSQIVAFRRAAPTYRLLVGGRGMTDGVFWDEGRYELVDGYRFRGRTYGGRRVPVPVAVLRDRPTGRLLAVISVHNPRDHWRDRAFHRQLREVRRLRREYDGRVSGFVAGDFNAGASVACRAHRLRLYSVGNRRCDGDAPIDQLLTDRHVTTQGYRRMAGRRVDRITDHPAVYRARFSIGATSGG